MAPCLLFSTYKRIYSIELSITDEEFNSMFIVEELDMNRKIVDIGYSNEEG